MKRLKQSSMGRALRRFQDSIRRTRGLLLAARRWTTDIAWRFGGHVGGCACAAALDFPLL
jgi:hypothetical protein